MELIVWSGGQTGVDQTALMIARSCGLKTGGWVPRGCKTDAGANPSLVLLYGCQEHPSADYAVRTAANVRDTSATVWFGVPSPGYRCTRRASESYEKPFYINPDLQTFLWIYGHHANLAKLRGESVLRLNFAGNRQRTHPESAAQAERILKDAFPLIRANQE